MACACNQIFVNRDENVGKQGTTLRTESSLVQAPVKHCFLAATEQRAGRHKSGKYYQALVHNRDPTPTPPSLVLLMLSPRKPTMPPPSPNPAAIPPPMHSSMQTVESFEPVDGRGLIIFAAYVDAFREGAAAERKGASL